MIGCLTETTTCVVAKPLVPYIHRPIRYYLIHFISLSSIEVDSKESPVSHFSTHCLKKICFKNVALSDNEFFGFYTKSLIKMFELLNFKHFGYKF